mgnify:CR=1 FL=1
MESMRFKGIYFSANAIGILGVFATMMQVWQAVSSKIRKEKIFFGVASLVCGGLTFLSGSRAALVGLLLAFPQIALWLPQQFY